MNRLAYRLRHYCIVAASVIAFLWMTSVLLARPAMAAPGEITLTVDSVPGAKNGLLDPLFSFDNHLQVFSSGGDGSVLWVSDGTSQGTYPFRSVDAWVKSRLFEDGILYNYSTEYSISDVETHTFWNNGFYTGLSGGDNAGFGVECVTYAGPNEDCIVPEVLYEAAGVFYLDSAGQLESRPVFAGSDASDDLVNVGLVKAKNFAIFAGKVVLSADDNSHGAEAWITDGSQAGTAMLADLRTGSGGSNPSQFTSFDGGLIFTADDGVAGEELWRSGGIAGDPVLVMDIQPGAGASSPRNLTVVGDTLFFTADDGMHGVELWRLRAGETPELALDIVPGAVSSEPRYLSAFGAGVFAFTMVDATTCALWFYDDDLGNGTLVNGAIPWSSSLGDYVQLSRANTPTYFYFAHPATGVLWRTDGTPAGTIHIPSDAHGNVVHASSLVSFHDALYFLNGAALWRSNGDAATTEQVAYFRYGNDATFDDPKATNGKLWYHQDYEYTVDIADYTDYPVFASDGTASGSGQIFYADEFGSHATACNGRYFFSNNENFWNGGDSAPYGFIVSDGTATGTIPAAFQPNSPPTAMAGFGDRFYYVATDDTGLAWFVHDESSGTTTLLTYIDDYLEKIYLSGDKAYLLGSQYGSFKVKNEVWVTDGTVAGTHLLASAPYNYLGDGAISLPGGGLAFFLRPKSLWKTDGTPEGTMALPAPSDGSTYQLTTSSVLLGKYLLFPGFTGADYAVYAADLDANDIKQIAPHDGSSALVRVGDEVWFLMPHGDNTMDLWATDGTPQGTHVAYANGGLKYPLLSAGAGAYCGEVHTTGSPDERPLLLTQFAAGTYTKMPVNFEQPELGFGFSLHAAYPSGGRTYLVASSAPTGNELWYIDAPGAILSIKRDGLQRTRDKTLHFKVAFTSDVKNVTADDFRLITRGQGLASVTEIVAEDAAHYDVAVDVGDVRGMVLLALKEINGISTANGVPLLGTGAGAGDYTDGEFFIEIAAHGADSSGDFAVSLSELLRVIQFYNALGLHCAETPGDSEDGYLPGPGPNQSCTPYDTDYNPQDWTISLSELLRIIQFYNALGYHYCPIETTEDGFCPGSA